MSPTVYILTAAITVLALVLSIFGAAWLNQRATERMVDQLGKRIDDLKQHIDVRINELEKRFDEKFKAVNQRIDSVEQRLDRIERQLDLVFKPTIPPRP